MIARPTTHAGLYVQMVGRVLRPHPGKTEAIVIDVVGASRKHALASLVDLIGERDSAEREARELDVDEVEELDGDEAGSYVQRAWLDGTLVSEDVDLFHGQRARWQRTLGGHWLVATGNRYLVVIPSTMDGLWDVVSADKSRLGASEWVVRAVADLGYAMAHAESVIGAQEVALAKRNARWRRNPASQAQVNRLAHYGVTVADGMLSGQASDLMAVWDASQRIDARVAMAAAR